MGECVVPLLPVVVCEGKSGCHGECDGNRESDGEGWSNCLGEGIRRSGGNFRELGGLLRHSLGNNGGQRVGGNGSSCPGGRAGQRFELGGGRSLRRLRDCAGGFVRGSSSGRVCECLGGCRGVGVRGCICVCVGRCIC